MNISNVLTSPISKFFFISLSNRKFFLLANKYLLNNILKLVSLFQASKNCALDREWARIDREWARIGCSNFIEEPRILGTLLRYVVLYIMIKSDRTWHMKKHARKRSVSMVSSSVLYMFIKKDQTLLFTRWR